MELPEDQSGIIELFKQGYTVLENTLACLSDFELDYSPSNGGWTIRQIIHHITDGDDLWKTGIKIAMGNEQAEFNLSWYSAFPQTEWAKSWRYKERSIDESLALFKANRVHILQLLEYIPEGWKKTIRFRDSNGQIEMLPVGAVIKMQADHLLHHIKRILAIHQEITGM